MKTLKFKTNVNCGGCIAKVTPHLNKLKGIDKWSVDTTTPMKVLTVETTTHPSTKWDRLHQNILPCKNFSEHISLPV